MEVIIDYNNDKISMNNGNTKLEFPVKDIDKIKVIIEELINMIYDANDIDSSTVTLIKIDEDNRILLGEW